MKSALTIPFFFLLGVLPTAAGLKLFYNKDLLSSLSDVLETVLKATKKSRSSIILFSDGTTSADVVRQIFENVQPSWGMTIFEALIDAEDFNATEKRLTSMIREARTMFQDMISIGSGEGDKYGHLRIKWSSWDVTVLIVTNNRKLLTNFIDLCDENRLPVWTTRILIVTDITREELEGYMESYWTLSMMNSMVLHLSQDMKTAKINKGEILAYMPYQHKDSKHVVHIGKWTEQRGLRLSSVYRPFPEKNSNFYGSPMNVTCWPFMPYFMSLEEVTGDNSLSETFTGRDYIMLETLASLMNFTINILPVASWDEMMLKVILRESFMSPMKMSILPHLLEDMDFSIAYEPETLTFTMKKPELKPRWENLYYPLSHSVWGLTLASLFLAPFLLFLIDQLRPNKNSQQWAKPWLVTQEILATFFGQPLSPKIPQRDSFRILLGTWLIFSYVIGTAYRANLTAFLTLPKYPPRVETLKEFIDAESIMLIPPDTVDFYNGFKQSPPGDLRTLSERMFFVPDISAGFPRVATENAGYMYERRNMELNIARYYTNQKTSWTPFYVARDNIWPGSSAWPIIRDAPFKPNIDKYIRQFIETGLLIKWDQDIVDLFKRATREFRRNKKIDTLETVIFDAGSEEDQAGSIKPLSITHLQGPLILLLLSLLIAVLAFFAEVLLV